MSTEQSSLPPGAVPFFIMVYANKNRLSSFGTAKGYPAIAVCAHLPILIRNGERCGKRVCVGWFPIVSTFFPNSKTCHLVHYTNLFPRYRKMQVKLGRRNL